MTAEFKREGIHFLYPENWKMDDQSPAQGMLCAASLEAPCGAIWTLNVEKGRRDCKQLAAAILRAMSEEYEELESEPRIGHMGEDLETAGYEMHFYCMDMVVKAIVECFHWENRTVMIMSQAETRDHAELTPIFQAITVSLLSDD